MIVCEYKSNAHDPECLSPSSGKLKDTVVPVPCWLSIETLPPRAWTMVRTAVRPMPFPAARPAALRAR